MHAYGHIRRDKFECKYGCCTTKSGKKKDCRVRVDRQNRKSARQAFRNEINYGLDEIRQELVDFMEEIESFDDYFYEPFGYSPDFAEDDDDFMDDTYDLDDYFPEPDYCDMEEFY